jgi:hypothetical protein
MRFFLLLTLAFVMTGCRRPLDPTIYAQFESIERSFQEATTPDQYVRVAAAYQEMIDQDVVSGVIFYNQGNAFMRADMLGRAVASYRRAQRYRPRDPQLAANLRLAMRGAEPSRRPIIEYVLFWQDWISFPGKFRLNLWAGFATFLLATVNLFLRARVWARISIVGLAAALLLVISAGYDWHRFEHTRHGVVVLDEVVARKGNSLSYEPAFNTPLPETTEFIVRDQRGAWLLIELSGGEQGWIESEGGFVY